MLGNSSVSLAIQRRNHAAALNDFGYVPSASEPHITQNNELVEFTWASHGISDMSLYASRIRDAHRRHRLGMILTIVILVDRTVIPTDSYT